ncbi:olfactory receptor 2A1/2A42-like [Ranitomeya imitator]|uniref:olfactory receptor 2A1/2A42-like n=1 Tax=Ranitomeya imitator TaxID=111125 RepID=UPI0037E9C27F
MSRDHTSIAFTPQPKSGCMANHLRKSSSYRFHADPPCDFHNTHTCYLPQENNLTAVTEFFILGFQVSQCLRIVLFCLFHMIYCGTIFGNVLIIILVSTSKILHTPMYFFISQLSVSDILVITDIVPNMLHIILNNGATITFIDCITQFYFLCVSEAFECLLLAVMSYDRYVAICIPLRYTSIMTSAHCVTLSITCWLLEFSIFLIYIIQTAKLNFCGPNIMDYLYCDIVPLLELSCSYTYNFHLGIYVIGIPNLLIPTTIIILSYTYIVLAILRISSSTGRQKAFSTCSSHLIVVSIFYWTMFIVYVIPTRRETVTMNKILSLLFTVFTPLVNPIIYSLRNNDIRKAIQGTFNKRIVWSLQLKVHFSEDYHNKPSKRINDQGSSDNMGRSDTISLTDLLTLQKLQLNKPINYNPPNSYQPVGTYMSEVQRIIKRKLQQIH